MDASRYAVVPFPSNRQFVVSALRSGRRAAPMYGFLDLDITDAKRLLEAHDPPLSFTAFVVSGVARAVASHPDVHAYRNWRGRLVMHRQVDVSTIIEVPTQQGMFPMVHTMRHADGRSVADLSEEIRRVKAQPLGSHAKRSQRMMTVVTHIPGLLRLFCAFMKRSRWARTRSGTVTVSAVGMFGSGGGFAVAPLTLMTLQVIVGGISSRPRVVDGHVMPRDVLDLSVAFDHNVVDGAPAARFCARLRDELEHGLALDCLDLRG